MAKVDGKTVKVGDWVCFKSDVEQCGQVAEIKRDMWGKDILILRNKNGFDGDYIGGQECTQERAEDCWIE